MEESGDRRVWVDLVGINTHVCKYLPGGKKFSCAELFVSVTGLDIKKEEASAGLKSVAKFISNCKQEEKRKGLRKWKSDLLNELDFDILLDRT